LTALRYVGVLAAVLAWAVIIACVSLNPWFVFTKNALSDLGGPKASYPWLYNYGLVTTGALIIAFASYALSVSSNRLEEAASSFMIVAGAFLAMIGVFHEGTYPHVFVSNYFFAQMDVVALVWGAGSIASGRTRSGLGEVLVGLVGPAGAIAFRWPSSATLEVFGVVLIDVLVLLMTFDLGELEGLTRRSSRWRRGSAP